MLVLVPVYTINATQTEDLHREKIDRIPKTPMFPTIVGPIIGDLGVGYEYEVSYEDPEGDDVFFKINWGDGRIQNWDGPYKSGEVVKYTHCWSPISFPGGGYFNIMVQAKDSHNLLSRISKFEISMNRKNDVSIHPILSAILNQISELLILLKAIVNQ
jgi:hypothetical protein